MEGFICHIEKLKLSFISSGEIFEVLERVMQSDVMIDNVSDCGGPRGVRPRLEGKPRTPLSSRVATRHSSVLAWRIPGTGKPGGLPSMGLHRVRHD